MGRITVRVGTAVEGCCENRVDVSFERDVIFRIFPTTIVIEYICNGM